MQSKDVKTYLAGLCLTVLLSGSSLAIPQAASAASG